MPKAVLPIDSLPIDTTPSTLPPPMLPPPMPLIDQPGHDANKTGSILQYQMGDQTGSVAACPPAQLMSVLSNAGIQLQFTKVTILLTVSGGQRPQSEPARPRQHEHAAIARAYANATRRQECCVVLRVDDHSTPFLLPS